MIILAPYFSSVTRNMVYLFKLHKSPVKWPFIFTTQCELSCPCLSSKNGGMIKCVQKLLTKYFPGAGPPGKECRTSVVTEPGYRLMMTTSTGCNLMFIPEKQFTIFFFKAFLIISQPKFGQTQLISDTRASSYPREIHT